MLVEQLELQRAEEALGDGIVEAVAYRAHRSEKASGAQAATERPAGWNPIRPSLHQTLNRTVYPTREHAKKDVARYIEFRYNVRRLHSALGYRTPKEAHDEYLKQQAAA